MCCRCFSLSDAHSQQQRDSTARLARDLFAEHGLDGWVFRFDHARQRCGSCNYTRREITLSRHFVAANDADEIRATLLHEIAHALVGPGKAHGREWRAAARRIGAPLTATNPTATMPVPRWRLVCTQCRQTVAERHRRSLDLRRVRCGYCRTGDGTLEWVGQHPANL